MKPSLLGRYISLVFVILTLKGFGQKNEIDSLLVRLATNQDESFRVHLLNGLADNYRSINTDTAIIYAKRALDQAEKLNYGKGIASSYAHLGFAYFTKADDDLAYEYFLKALDLSTELNDSINLCLIYEGLGRFHNVIDQEEIALEMLQKSLAIANKYSLIWRKTHILLALSLLYEELGDDKKRLSNVRQSLELSEELGYTQGIISASNLLGTIYSEVGDNDEARIHLTRALNLALDQRNLKRANYALIRIAEIQMAEGEHRMARRSLQQAVDLVNGTDFISYEQDAVDKQYQLALKEGNYKNALEYFVKSSALLDSIYNRQTTNAISRLTTKFETEKKQQEIELQKQQILLLERDQEIKTLWRNILIGGIMVVILVGAIIFYFQRAKNIRKQKYLGQKIEFQSKELASYTINFIQKRNLFETLDDSLKEVESSVDHTSIPKIKKIRRMIKQQENIDKDWDEFKLYFESVHKDFFNVLKKKHPEVSGSDLKLCALIKLNMSIKEMSSILGISPDSVKTARHRLRKKLSLDHGASLHEYVAELEKSIS